ncbi:MAG TPA: hypothetical protein VJ732_13050 [Bryobacteraceae bacterium]|nr:hypothetical protein [Bryobacteraceae bacterium]
MDRTYPTPEVEKKPVQAPIRRGEAIQAAVYALVLLWVNAYVCQELFRNQTAFMNSMHGFWIALAERAGDSWFHANWWPYWDCGIPFEYTYAPLIPALTAAWVAVRGIPHALALQMLTAVVYCLVPLTLFVLAWLWMRAPGYSFAAALFYSLAAPTQWIVPDNGFALKAIWDARRLDLVGQWDDTPHLAALALLPLVILLLAHSLRTRRLLAAAATAGLIAIMALASEFGVVEAAMTAWCLVFVLGRGDLRRNLAFTAAIGAFAYLLIAPFLPPSMLLSIRQASASGEDGWSMGSVTAIALVALGWVVLWPYLRRWTSDWRLQFFALLAYLTSSVPLTFTYLHRQFLPQPSRYKLEMEFALALLLVFGLRRWFAARRRPLQAALVFLLLALAGEQIIAFRQFSKYHFAARDVTGTIEYRAALWAERNLPGVRVMMPGTLAKWTNAFTGIEQFSGSSWSKAANQVQQRGLAAVYWGGSTPEEDARVSLAWLEAFGVGAVAVSGPNSREYWKPYKHPGKFQGVLPVLWSEDDVTIYRVPQRTESLAHVVPAEAVVRQEPRGPADIAPLGPYVRALEDPALPPTRFAWEGRNRMRIQATLSPGEALSIQETYDSGWHAAANGLATPVERDGLGLIVLHPACQGACEVQLDYIGGGELRVCRYASLLAWAVLIALIPVSFTRRWRRI